LSAWGFRVERFTTAVGLITLMQEDGVDPQLVQAITHEGMATETAGVFRGYTVWGWEALCGAMLKLQINPRGPASAVTTELPIGAARPAELSIGHSTGHYSVPLFATSLESLCIAGGVDGARTRGLRRDRPAL
jgi:hypothetical protein